MAIIISKRLLSELLDGESTVNSPNVVAEGLEFSSSEIEGGEVFIGLKGEKRHGQDYSEEAISLGASLVVVEDKDLLQTAFGDKVIVVKDTYKALISIAQWWRSKLPVRVLAITGSVGKTTTKELCGGILSSFFPGSYAKKSFNNHIGVPYTVCQIDQNSSWTVCEIGTNHPGEIKPLVELVRPNVSTITAVGPAHIEHFGSIKNIAAEKLEITAGLVEDGTLIVNGDSYDLLVGLEAKKIPVGITVRKFGLNTPADLLVSDVALLGSKGSEFKVSYQGISEKVKLNLFGRSSVSNAAAAILSCLSLYPTLSLVDVCEGISKIPVPDMRLNFMELPSGRRILNDCYNANPVSMAAAIETFTELIRPGDKVGLVLGDMKELGAESERFHGEIGKLVSEIPQLNEVVTVGEFAHLYASGLSGVRVSSFRNTGDAKETVAHLNSNILLFKGSRGVALETLVKTLEST